jgi:hypothetical protein
MSGILQAVMRDFRSYGPNWPVASIGDAYGGGFFGGQINVSGTKYNLVVAPKASGENSAREWGTYGVTTAQTSVIDGPTNSAVEAALGASYQAATFCEGLTIGGYSDWYLPARNELEVLYYYLKPTAISNDTISGSNANAVSPEPVSTNYTSGSPAQTTSTAFKTGGSEALNGTGAYWTSTEFNASFAWFQQIYNGEQLYGGSKSESIYARAVRRVPV